MQLCQMGVKLCQMHKCSYANGLVPSPKGAQAIDAKLHAWRWHITVTYSTLQTYTKKLSYPQHIPTQCPCLEEDFLTHRDGLIRLASFGKWYHYVPLFGASQTLRLKRLLLALSLKQALRRCLANLPNRWLERVSTWYPNIFKQLA